jgi:phospholipase/carboxylesterase
VPIDDSTRRVFIGAIPGMLVGTLSAQAWDDRSASRLRARPGPSAARTSPGLHKLGLRADRDALLYIPESVEKLEKAPLVVSLHGASRNADRGIELLRSLSDEQGFLLLAPASEAQTWDAILGSYGSDAAFINRSLARTFELRNVDPARGDGRLL